MNLLDFAGNVTSQCGEDGILAKMFEIIPATGPRTCVEFGASDGIEHSNTRQLILSGWRSVQIEPSPTRYARLYHLYRDNAAVHTVCAAVGWGPEDSLDTILNRNHPLPLDFDFLSIDVDGLDVPIWRAVNQYRPKVVCIEFNHTWPIYLARTQAADPAVQKGASLAATVSLATAKRYELVCCTAWNAIFVTAELFGLFDLDPVAPNDPRILGSHYPQGQSYTAFDYDGTRHDGGPQKCPWTREGGQF